MAKKQDPDVQVESKSDVKSAKLQALNVAIDQIKKSYGAGSIMKLGDNKIESIEVIPTGSIALDSALGVGGYPRGRIVEIYGPESSGKTTLALHAIAEAQKQGGVAAFIDAEHALDPGYAKNLGVDVDNLLLSQPDYGEQALEICETLVRSGAVDIIVIDSVAALVPKAEIDGEMGDAVMGAQARLMSQAMRKITAIANRSKTTLIFLNQIRMKIGVMFGNPETTTGGNALKFYATIRIDIRRGEKITKGDELLGNVTRVKVVKNKVAPPFKEVEFDIIYGKGIDRYSSLIAAAVEKGVLQKSGAWYRRGDTQLAQGKDALKTILEGDEKLALDIAKEVRAKMAV
ncbi:MAG: recombinase RecA [bacterium]